MDIRVKQGVSGDPMLTVSWPPEDNALGIGAGVLWPVIATVGMSPKSFAIFPDSAVLFPPPGKAMWYLQRMLDALTRYPTTSKAIVHVFWASPELRETIMKVEE